MTNEKQAAVSDPLIGQVFGGKYVMCRLIGRGGVGLVYLAEDRETGDELVLKLLSPDWSRKPEAVRRFEREAERLASVRHPNVVRLLDQGHDAGRAFLVMEYLQGELLSDYIAERTALDLPTFVPIAAQVLKGIGHAHTRGVMLRDIKPANIMLCERKGRANFVKILDFGLAKLIRDEQPVTEEHVLGTAGYLAPEVIRGNAEVDLRVDVFSLGALFYFMLSGRLPFEGDESATVFYKTIHDDPTPLHDVLPTDHDIPEGLIELIHGCLSKDPGDRLDDANALVEALIDVVPASLFRLPKVERPATAAPSPPGYGNTGMVALVGDAASTGQHPPVPGVPTPIEDSEPVTLGDHVEDPDDTDAIPPPPVVLEPPRSRAPVIGLGIAIAVLAAGFGYVAVRDTGSAPAADASVSSVRESAPDYTGTLKRVGTLIESGELDEAGSLLDTLRGPADEAPALADDVARLEASLSVAKLMAAAASFEGDGELDAAARAYREVLESDPSHAAAARRLAALSSDDDDDAAVAPVEIASQPPANLFIDGEDHGTTPFSGDLPLGEHELRMTARGFRAWKGTLEVTKTGTEDLLVRLEGKSRAKRPARDTDPVGPSPTADEPESTPESPAAATPSKAKTKKKSVFLPTTDESGENGGGVFLPTKD